MTHLMAALPALVRAARYGDVRGTDPARLGEVATELVTRICAGLPVAVTSLDETAERVMRDRIDARAFGHRAARRRDQPRPVAGHAGAAGRVRCPPLISGRLTRLLLDAGRLAADVAGLRMSRALSAAVPPPAAAGWAEGFLAGSGLLLVHDDKLLALVDGWLAGLSADAFAAVLPALRRTFGGFAAAGTAGRSGSRPPGRGRTARGGGAAGLPWSPRPTTTSISRGRRSRPGPWPPILGLTQRAAS